ncbi:MAG: hypothetical protein WA843_02055 [Candidatus Saccharimonadales bacterium]
MAFSTVRSALDQALRGSAEDAAAIAQRYSDGFISVAEFEREMQELIKSTQIYSVAVAAGGFDSMTQRHVDLLQERLTSQFGYMSDWADDLASGARGSSKQMAARARMYVKSARASFSDVYGADQTLRGLTQEQNILGNAEHCAGCLAQTARGWQPIGSLMPIGQRDCLTNCECLIDYR